METDLGIMNSKSKKELAILTVLLGLLSISVFSQLFKGTDVPVGLRKPSTTNSRNAASNEVIAVDLLSNETSEFTSVKRNIFQFGSGGGRPEPSEDTEEFVQPPTPVQPPVPPSPEVHYLGFYYEKESGLKMAALSNSGRIFVGKVGQVVGGKYEVLEIAQDYVLLKLRMQDGKIIRVPFGKAPASFIEPIEDQE
ncbi:MAG: hypothetical protein ACRD4B_06240 [Acidobacteriota bacterium]